MKSLRRLWRRLVVRWRRPLLPLAPARNRTALANALLETVDPEILVSAGYARYRRVYRRRVRYARLRQGPHGPQGPHSPQGPVIDHRV